jgi:hypothetical protein
MDAQEGPLRAEVGITCVVLSDAVRRTGFIDCAK